MKLKLPMSSDMPTKTYDLGDLTKVTRESGRELLAVIQKIQDDTDTRVEKWLDRADRYWERMRDG